MKHGLNCDVFNNYKKTILQCFCLNALIAHMAIKYKSLINNYYFLLLAMCYVNLGFIFVFNILLTNLALKIKMFLMNTKYNYDL